MQHPWSRREGGSALAAPPVQNSSQDQTCIKAQVRSVCKKIIRILQRKVAGVWAERAGVEVAVTEEGWGCEALEHPQLAQGCELGSHFFISVVCVAALCNAHTCSLL